MKSIGSWFVFNVKLTEYSLDVASSCRSEKQRKRIVPVFTIQKSFTDTSLIT